MEDSSKADALRSLMKRALTVRDELLNAWSNEDTDLHSAFSNAQDIELLRQLIIRRIDPLNAFEMLAKIDRTMAIDVLFARYLGHGLDPDRKYGGYISELSMMLDDLKEIGGESVLRRVVDDPRFQRKLLSDSRVVESFAEALDIRPDRFLHWLETSSGMEKKKTGRDSI